MDGMRFSQINDKIMDFDFEENASLQENQHQNIEIIYVLEGGISLRVNDVTYEMGKDDMIVVDSLQKHSYVGSGSVLVGIVHINYFQLIKYMDVDKFYFNCNSAIDKNNSYREMQKTLNKIFRLYFDKKKESVYLTSLYFSLLHTLISNFSFRIDEYVRDSSKNEDEKRIEYIINYVNYNYQQPISLNDLAEQLYLSTAYLSKYIKRYVGMNFVDYVNGIRLQRAMEDIKFSDKSLTRIALDNGFPNPASFGAVFKREYEMTPSAWIKNYQSEFEKIQGERKAKLLEKEQHIQEFLEQNPISSEGEDNNSLRMLQVNAQIGVEFVHNWNKMINIGSITALLQSDIQEHLIILQEELGFKYVRFWDIFSKEMLLDLRKSEGKFNFKKIDKVFDFLMNNYMHPFIELGFKPVNLLRTTDNMHVLQEREIIFDDSSEFAATLHAFLIHCVNRYGIEEVEKWYFEQWGDPRITLGEKYGKFFKVFETAYETIKSVSPNTSVGGAGFGRLYSTLDFREIIELWKQNCQRPDFVSLYGYPYMSRSSVDSQNSDRIQDPDFINNHVLMMKEVLAKADFPVEELIVSEWSSSVSDWNSLNDSVYKGAFMLKTIVDNIDTLDSMGYWLATDALTEYFDTGMLLHGGNGLLSVDGIRKPAFYAMQFAGKLGHLMLGRNENAVVTASERGNYSIVCHNYVSPNFRYYLKKEDEVDVQKQFLLFDEAESIVLNFRIDNVKNGIYIVKQRALNEDQGSVQDEWREMDYSEKLTQQDIQYLRQTSIPKIRIFEQKVDNNTLVIETKLRPHEIQSIHLIYQME